MGQNTQTTTSLNYAALHEPVTEKDVEAYKQYVGASGFTNSIWLQVVLAVFAGAMLSIVFVPMLNVSAGSPLSQLFIVLAWTAATIGSGFLFDIAFKHYNKTRARMHKFTTQNGITLIIKRPDPSYAGMIFDEGHSREIDAALVIPGRAEIGNYVYVTGSGKNRTTHPWSYIKTKLDRKLPHMALDAKKNNLFGRISNLPDTFDKSQTLSLEGDFNKHFTLYAPKQYERDALYVFTPDVMAALIDNGSGFDMEVIGDELYIYKTGYFNLGSEKDIRSALSIVDVVRGELQDQTAYYADERVGDRTQNIIAPEGAQLKSGVNWVAIVLAAFIIVIWVWAWLNG